MSDFIIWLEDIQLEIIASSKTSQITIPEKDNAKPEAANNEVSKDFITNNPYTFNKHISL
jgi:hypothetical protein